MWVIFALLDPDPDSESGSTDVIESGSGTLKKRICCMKCLRLGEAGEGEAELGLYAGSLLQELKEKNIKCIIGI